MPIISEKISPLFGYEVVTAVTKKRTIFQDIRNRVVRRNSLDVSDNYIDSIFNDEV
jgi:hypothetical protein